MDLGRSIDWLLDWTYQPADQLKTMKNFIKLLTINTLLLAVGTAAYNAINLPAIDATQVAELKEIEAKQKARLQ